jgi:hypothetical protein
MPVLYSLRLHGRHTQNLAPLLLAQLSPDDAVDTCSDRIPRLVDEYTCVIVKSDHTAVPPLHGLLGPDHHGMPDVAAFDLGGTSAGHAFGVGAALFLDNDDDAVTYYILVRKPSEGSSWAPA